LGGRAPWRALVPSYAAGAGGDWPLNPKDVDISKLIPPQSRPFADPESEELATVTQLDLLYAQTLQVGFIVLKQAFESGAREWIDAELELLHNVPSLIGESNKRRHRYFWDKERTRYIEWVSAPGRDEARSRMRTYYEPIWNEMKPDIETLFPDDSDCRSLRNG
jgi:hypothetical protein